MLLLSAAALSAQVELKTAAQAKLSAADVAVKIADRIFGRYYLRIQEYKDGRDL